jgi:hypothetical protein
LLVELALIQLARPAKQGQSGGNARPAIAEAAAGGEKKSPDVNGGMQRHGVPQAPADAAPAHLPRPARRSVGAVSIRQHLDAPVDVVAEPGFSDRPGEQPEAGNGVEPARELNQALLLKAWGDYAKARKREGKSSLHATLVANAPVISGPHTITFTIVNTVQENYMREEKPGLLSHLGREMGIPGLDLHVIKQEATDLRPRYTAKDRFMIMAEKNPALLELRDALDLDLG